MIMFINELFLSNTTKYRSRSVQSFWETAVGVWNRESLTPQITGIWQNLYQVLIIIYMFLYHPCGYK